MQFAPLELGNAIVTPGFLLPNRWIIHVRGPKYHIDPEPASNLARAMENVLRVAEENGIRKIAVPAISMGIYAYPPEEAVPILVDATFRALPGLRVLEEIRFVVLKTKLATLFQLVIADAEKRFGDLKRASALKHWGVE